MPVLNGARFIWCTSSALLDTTWQIRLPRTCGHNIETCDLHPAVSYQSPSWCQRWENILVSWPVFDWKNDRPSLAPPAFQGKMHFTQGCSYIRTKQVEWPDICWVDHLMKWRGREDSARKKLSECHTNATEFFFTHRPLTCINTNHWSDDGRLESCCQRHMSINRFAVNARETISKRQSMFASSFRPARSKHCLETRFETSIVTAPRVRHCCGIGFELLRLSFSSGLMPGLLVRPKQLEGTFCPMLRNISVDYRQFTPNTLDVHHREYRIHSCQRHFLITPVLISYRMEVCGSNGQYFGNWSRTDTEQKCTSLIFYSVKNGKVLNRIFFFGVVPDQTSCGAITTRHGCVLGHPGRHSPYDPLQRCPLQMFFFGAGTFAIIAEHRIPSPISPLVGKWFAFLIQSLHPVGPANAPNTSAVAVAIPKLDTYFPALIGTGLNARNVVAAKSLTMACATIVCGWPAPTWHNLAVLFAMVPVALTIIKELWFVPLDKNVLQGSSTTPPTTLWRAVHSKPGPWHHCQPTGGFQDCMANWGDVAVHVVWQPRMLRLTEPLRGAPSLLHHWSLGKQPRLQHQGFPVLDLVWRLEELVL